MKTIYLIRHGETNNQDIFDSQSSALLNQFGKKKVQQLAKWLKQQAITQIYASPLPRTQTTAEIIAQILGLSITIDKQWLEIDFGNFEGKAFQEIIAEYPKYVKELCTLGDHFQYPKGEAIYTFKDRVWSAFRELFINTRDDPIAVITHKGVIQAILAKILNTPTVFLPIRIDPASCTVLKGKNENDVIIQHIKSSV